MIKTVRKISVLIVALLALVLLTCGMLSMTPASADIIVDTMDVITIERTAEVRLTNTGLRFPVKVHKENLEKLTAVGGEYEGYTSSLGVAVIPTVVLGKQDLDASKTYYDYKDGIQPVLHINLVNKQETVIGEGTSDQYTEQTYHAVITNIPDQGYETQLSARAYVKLTKDGAEDVYIQTADVATRSIAQVINSFYTDTENPPTSEEKGLLEDLIDNQVSFSLAQSLADGYYADFTSSTYECLVREYVDTNASAPTSVEVLDEFEGETNVLKISMTSSSISRAGFTLKLPVDPGQSKIKVKFYNQCSVGQGLKFVKPGTVDDGLTGDIASATKNKWNTQVLDYTGLDKTDEVVIYTWTGSGGQDVVIYLSWVREHDLGNLADTYLADFSTYGYEDVISTVATPHGTPQVTASYVGDFQGAQGVLKVETTSANTYYAFKINLPKNVTTKKVEVRMYIAYEEGVAFGLVFGSPDTADTHSGDGYKPSEHRNVWINYVFDYSAYAKKDVIEVCFWGGVAPVFYLDSVRELGDVVAPTDENVIADFDSYEYEGLVSKFSTYYEPMVEWLPEFMGETGVLKIRMLSNDPNCTGGFVLKLPKDPGRVKMQVKIYDVCAVGQGAQFIKPGTTENLNSGNVNLTKNAWKVYDLDYTQLAEGAKTDEFVLKTWTGAKLSIVEIYLSYIIIAE